MTGSLAPPRWVRWRDTAIVSIARATSRLGRLGRRGVAPAQSVHLAIQSGLRGWELIEYEEMGRSAEDYLGAGSVVRFVVPDRAHYLSSTRRDLAREQVTHLVYDPRTGSQTWLPGIAQALWVSWATARRGITPICWLTDLPIRRWRLQCAIVSARSGVTVTLMDPARVDGLFPNERLVGPSMMALSRERIDVLAAAREARQASDRPRAVFSGALYEPRTTILTSIQRTLREAGKDLELLTRSLNGARVSNDEYWQRLVDADILVTTADQVVGPGIDDTGLPHLIFRYSEALAAGALLIAPSVPGIERYFVPGEHFVAFDGVEDGAARIAHYLDDTEGREQIARAGSARLRDLVERSVFWTSIDDALEVPLKPRH